MFLVVCFYMTNKTFNPLHYPPPSAPSLLELEHPTDIPLWLKIMETMSGDQEDPPRWSLGSPTSLFLTSAPLTSTAFFVARLALALTHRHQPLAVGAAVHAWRTRGPQADLCVGEAGSSYFNQPSRSRESVREVGQAMHSLCTALVEHPHRH